MIASECDKRADTMDLLPSKPQKLTEQELQRMEALGEVLYDIFARQQSERPSVQPGPTALTTASGSTMTSTTVN